MRAWWQTPSSEMNLLEKKVKKNENLMLRWKQHQKPDEDTTKVLRTKCLILIYGQVSTMASSEMKKIPETHMEVCKASQTDAGIALKCESRPEGNMDLG